MRDLAVRAPTVAALERALRCDDLLEWVETKATELATLGSRHGCVHLTRELLQSRGIRAVVKERSHRLAHDAVIEVDRSGYVIRYSATRPTRIRFSLAHEIGHTYFGDTDGRVISRVEYRNDPTVESICNYFARALLLPRERLIARLRDLVGEIQIPPLHLVPQLADEFHVSEEPLARRLVFDVFEGFVAALCITKPSGKREWRTTWCVPRGEHDLPSSSGWRVPLDSNGRLIPWDMVPSYETGRTTVTSVDGRWADLCQPKTLAQCRVPFARLPAMVRVQAVVASAVLEPALFDEPAEKCFVALTEERQRNP